MGRKSVFSISAEQEKYIKENTHKNCTELAKDLNVNRINLYRWLVNNGIEVANFYGKLKSKAGKEGFFNEREFFKHYAW